jgi:hypothetical protein
LLFLRCDIYRLNRNLAVFRLWSISLKHCIEFFRRDLFKAYVGHMHGFVVGVGCQLVLLVLIVQISDVVVADTSSFVVLAAEKHTGLG